MKKETLNKIENLLKEELENTSRDNIEIVVLLLRVVDILKEDADDRTESAES